MLHYRKGSGAYSTAALTALGEDRYSVPLPAAPCEATFDYYLSAEGDGGTVVHEPLNAPATTHTVRAIVEQERLFDDFETDTGWTTVPAEPNDAVGAWTRVIPEGTTTGSLANIQAQPDEDHTPDPGEMCFLTGQHHGGGEGLTDVDGGPVQLLSPVIALDAPDALVSYARWFFSRSVDDPSLEDELLVELSLDAGGNWHEAETVASTGSWEMHSFRLSDFPEVVGNQLQVRFSTVDEPDNSLTEAAIDDVEVRAILCVPGPGDYDGNGRIEPADFGFLADCLTGPVAESLDDWCATFDFDEDADVDLDDWRRFQFRFAPRVR